MNVPQDMKNSRALAEINKGLAAHAECVEKCDVAEQCFCDIGDRRDIIEEQRIKLTRMKEILFPSSP